MATVGGGNQPNFRGKLGGVVYYLLNDVLIARTIGVNNNPPTISQLESRMATRVVARFLKPLKLFINVGFELSAKQKKSNAYNEVFSYLRQNAIKGVYPEIDMEYEKVVLTSGTMPLPPNIRVWVTDLGLTFSWDQEGEVTGAHWSDQVMVVAYFPKLNRVIFYSAGARREQGVEHIPLQDFDHGNFVETYFSFIANDRRSIATSIYTGRLQW